MNPIILGRGGGFGPGFLNQVPTLGFMDVSGPSVENCKAPDRPLTEGGSFFSS